MKSAFIDDFQIHSSSHNPNGIYLSEGLKGLSSPNVRYSGSDRGGMSGHTARATWYGGRSLPWEGWIASDDVVSYNEYRRQFMQVVAALTDSNGQPITKTLRFTMDDDQSYQMEVVLTSEPILPDENPLYAEFMLPLFAPEPQIFSQTQVTTAAITRPSGLGVLMPSLMPALSGATTGGSIVVTNAGTMFTWPVITLSGQLTNPIIRNDTNGQFMQLNYTTSASDTISIDMLHNSVSLNNAQSLITTPTDDSTFWWLEKGANAINFSSGATTDTGTMSMAFYHAFVGV